MTSNHLKLNADKTESLWFGTSSQLKKITPVDFNRLTALEAVADATFKHAVLETVMNIQHFSK